MSSMEANLVQNNPFKSPKLGQSWIKLEHCCFFKKMKRRRKLAGCWSPPLGIPNWCLTTIHVGVYVVLMVMRLI
jgi:hypothetical protein